MKKLSSDYWKETIELIYTGVLEKFRREDVHFMGIEEKSVDLILHFNINSKKETLILMHANVYNLGSTSNEYITIKMEVVESVRKFIKEKLKESTSNA